MQYRQLGQTGWQVSVLGFGAMRLPLLPGATDSSQIDTVTATAMLRRALEGGVNYVDTAYVYHGGASEVWLGAALREIARDIHPDARDPLAKLLETVKVATKLPVFRCTRTADFDRFLDESLERLGLDTLPMYLVHGLEDRVWERMLDLGLPAWLESALGDGRIEHAAFSFHDRYPVFERILTATDLWDVCQIQLNYMDVEHQAGLRGLHLAAGLGKGIVIMEPVRGGRLAKEPPPEIARIWDDAPVSRTPVEWALRWIWDLPEVAVALSGMSEPAQVEENLRIADAAVAGSLTAEELDAVARVREAYRARMQVDCTACGYCAPCPNDVQIDEILGLINDAAIYGDLEKARESYEWVGEEHWADRCDECGECESRCPQGIAVREWLQRGHAMLRPHAPEER